MRILLVDPDSSLVDILRHRLRTLGYEVDTAFSGPQARSKMQGRCADILICAQGLRDAAGKELCEAIRGDARTRGAYVILMTDADGGVEERRDFGAADDCLAKPFGMDDLLGAIFSAERLLATYRAHGAMDACGLAA